MAINTQDLFSKFAASGLSRRAFSVKRKIPLSTLDYHLHKARLRNTESRVPVKSPLSFIPVSIPARLDSEHPISLIILRGRFDREELAGLLYSALR